MQGILDKSKCFFLANGGQRRSTILQQRLATKHILVPAFDAHVREILTVEQVLNVQAKAKELETSNDNNGLEVLKSVISASVEDGSDLSDEDYQKFPMDELSKLSQEIMKFSGFGEQTGK